MLGLRTVFLAGVAAVALASPALAADADDARIRALEQAIQALSQELQAIKAANAAAAAQTAEAAAKAAEEQANNAAQIASLIESQSAQYADVQNQRAMDTRVLVNNARPTFATADGQFAISLRGIFQYDAAYYAQHSAAPDLSSGTNFRRARIGFDGTFFTDWFFSFLYEMGGVGVESGKMSDAYVQYNGFAPLRFRAGSFATPSSLDDHTGTGDLLFAERSAPGDLARGIAAADGRQNFISVFAAGVDYYAAASLSGARSGDPATFDEQQAIVTRGAYRIYKDVDTNVVVNASTQHVYKVADSAASPAGASPITLQIGPEAAVDGTRLISTGAINANGLFNWALEGAANFRNVYVQGGYFDFTIYRRQSALPNPHFGGWYVQGSWVLTGEPRRYNAANATWQNPAAAMPFTAAGPGLGAWELAARYSRTDLNYRAGVEGLATPIGGIRGGIQDAWTLGLNWYPNANVRFEFDYQNVAVSKLSTTAPYRDVGQKLDIFSMRTQLAF